MAKKFDPLKHYLVPKHEKTAEKERKDILERFSISIAELPKIFSDDPAIEHLGPKEGDVIKITRKSPTAGTTIFYRCVINA
jgi:DNA-directed RNA polymerase subunit H